MLSRLSLLSVLVPFVSALTISTPANWTSGGPATITWATSPGDNPVFSLELSNPIFNEALALANNVDSSLQTISFTLPVVPATSGYTLQAVNITNINDIFAQSGSFFIGETLSSSIASSSSASGSVNASASGSATGIVTVSPASTTPFGSTVSGGASSASGSAASSGASVASSPAPSTFNGSGNGALSNLNLGYGQWAVMGLGAVFGVMATL